MFAGQLCGASGSDAGLSQVSWHPRRPAPPRIQRVSGSDQAVLQHHRQRLLAIRIQFVVSIVGIQRRRQRRKQKRLVRCFEKNLFGLTNWKLYIRLLRSREFEGLDYTRLTKVCWSVARVLSAILFFNKTCSPPENHIPHIPFLNWKEHILTLQKVLSQFIL